MSDAERAFWIILAGVVCNVSSRVGQTTLFSSTRAPWMNFQSKRP